MDKETYIWDNTGLKDPVDWAQRAQDILVKSKHSTEEFASFHMLTAIFLETVKQTLLLEAVLKQPRPAPPANES